MWYVSKRKQLKKVESGIMIGINGRRILCILIGASDHTLVNTRVRCAGELDDATIPAIGNSAGSAGRSHP
jgi:hypothetical protein